MWFAKDYQKMCMWEGAAALEADFVLQGVRYERLHSEDKHWNENFPYNYHYKHTLPPTQPSSSWDGCSGF